MDSRRRWWRGLLIIVCTCAATYVYFVVPMPTKRKHSFSSNDAFEANITASLPDPLLNRVYKKTDFINERGIVPAFWGDDNTNSNESSITWGPCYPPTTTVDWEKAMNVYANKTDYHPIQRHKKLHTEDLSDYCKPGFIIIGAGKCGTSSLYHYIGGHPRVLPASQKQIHYFKVSQSHKNQCTT